MNAKFILIYDMDDGRRNWCEYQLFDNARDAYKAFLSLTNAINPRIYLAQLFYERT